MKCQNCNNDGATLVRRVPFPDGSGYVTLLVPQHLCPDCIREYGEGFYTNYLKAKQEAAAKEMFGRDLPDESTVYGIDCRDGKCEW